MLGNRLGGGFPRVGTAGRIYLDHNATTAVRPEAAGAVAAALAITGNPSSIHGEGRGARKIIEDAREAVGAFIGASAANVVFTSGGTEALNLALSPRLAVAGEARPITRLLVSAIEHPAVRAGHRFATEAVESVPVQPGGELDLAALEAALARAGEERVLLALMAANNETGVIQPVRAAADLVHARGGLVLVDAVQAAGKIPLAMADLGADLLVLSAHKFGGPSGVGALAFGSSRLQIGTPLVRGGGQERGRRSGTENLSGIAGLGAAAVAARRDLPVFARLARLRDGLEMRMRAVRPDLVVFGAAAPRLANTTCYALSGVSAETALIAFDLAGIAVSSGSACSSGRVKSSDVLDSMGVPPDLMGCAIRVSLGWNTTAHDVDRAFSVWQDIVTRQPATGAARCVA